VRTFTRRFSRRTLGYSKKLENLKYAVALFIAHFNFCRIHSAHGKTPAQSAGLTNRTWTISELLERRNLAHHCQSKAKYDQTQCYENDRDWIAVGHVDGDIRAAGFFQNHFEAR
jgi:hypothetical protein